MIAEINLTPINARPLLFVTDINLISIIISEIEDSEYYEIMMKYI
jgi:hypothetical protein